MTDTITLPRFDDPAVQNVYKLLCDDETPPPDGEHWEGFLARRIVAALAVPKEPIPVHRCKEAAEHLAFGTPYECDLCNPRISDVALTDMQADADSAARALFVQAVNNAAPQTEPQREPVLAGRWHHGNGVLCSGSLRIARADFDTNPRLEMQERIFDDICEAMNRNLITPQPAPTLEPLTDAEIDAWWRSENGLEDCVMSKQLDFRMVVRAVEAAHAAKLKA